MGLGPSTKMTTLHHYRCPITRRLLNEKKLEFSGIIVNGVSERYDDKVFTAKRTGEMAEAMRLNGALVAIDGWGNHHIDFVQVFEELGKRRIPVVGLSYIGLQGRLVCTNDYVETIVDFNKNESGYESCIVGDNNLTDYDAMKAIALLKHKMKRQKWPAAVEQEVQKTVLQQLAVYSYPIQTVQWGTKNELNGTTLTIGEPNVTIPKAYEKYIDAVTVQIITPDQRHQKIHTNLDFMPLAAKLEGDIGNGSTQLLRGLTVMITGGDEANQHEPSNIGSSEGYLDEQVKFGQNGTPGVDDIILHIDVKFKAGQDTTAQGIRYAHALADQILQPIRYAMKEVPVSKATRTLYYDVSRWPRPKVGLIKVVSGLGNMYETSVFPREPGGFIGSKCLMDMDNTPVVISPTQCLDGVIHSLL